MLLDWIGRRRGRPECVSAAGAIEAAVDELLASPATRTADLGGALGTRAFGAALVRRLGTAEERAA